MESYKDRNRDSVLSDLSDRKGGNAAARPSGWATKNKNTETVHFLNQVDEADIFSQLDEDSQEEYVASMEAAVETEEVTVEPETVEEEPEETKVEETNSGKWKGILGIVGILAIVGAGIGCYFVSRSRKKKAAAKPDPDEDYRDDDDPNEDDVYADLEEADESEADAYAGLEGDAE